MGLCRLRGLFAVACVLCLDLCLGHEGSCPHSGFSSPAPQVHSCGDHDHDHDHDHDEGHHHHHDHGHHHEEKGGNLKLPEELAEEEDLKLYGFGTQYGHDHDHHHHHHVDGQSGQSDLSGLGNLFDIVTFFGRQLFMPFIHWSFVSRRLLCVKLNRLVCSC